MRTTSVVPAVVAGLTMLLGLGASAASASDVVISQAYGGGGNSGAPLNRDFVELLNRGTTPARVDGWSVQYASATGTGAFQAAPITGTIPPGGRFLVGLASGATGAALPAPDAQGSLNMSGSAGKVALARRATSLGCNGSAASPCTTSDLVDLVGYGTANFFEGSAPAPGTSNATALLRAGDGCVDTDDNRADFTTAAPAPRNAAAVATPCDRPTGTATADPSTVQRGGSTTLRVVVDGADAPPSTGLAVTADLRALGGPAEQPLAADGDVFRTVVDVPASLGGGRKPVPIAVRDAQGRTSATEVTVTVTEPCGDPATPVHEVQGAGSATPRAGEPTSVEAVVVGAFQAPGGFGGFYVQEPDAEADADPATSEGLFVFSTLGGVRPGDHVRVRGRATEFNRLTQLDRVSQVTPCPGGGAVTATPLTLPVADLADLERLEGMRVRSAQPLTVTETFRLGRFGELRLAAGGRLQTPTNVVEPGAPAAALAAENRRRSLVLDDGRSVQNPDPAPYGLSATNPLRSGDTVPELQGVLDERFSAYRVQPVGEVAVERTNPRPAAPAEVGGTLRVAAFNVLNFFDGPEFPTARGADTPFELERQTAKEVAALAGLDADVVGLMELENDRTAIRTLVEAVNARMGEGTYDYVDTGVVGTDAIRVGLLYKPAVVRPVGEPAVLDTSVDPRFDDTRNRPTIAQAFELTANLERVTVVVNHLKSKGSACAGDPDAGDGQGNCNGTRVRAAQALTDWLATDPTGSGTTDTLVVGDLNSYAMEDPVDVLKAGGYVDLVRRFGGPGAYSYVFDGQAGYLDHALASASLAERVSGTTEWHVNADEPTVMDYNTEFKTAGQVASLYAPDAFRSSDHDPVLVGLDLRPSLEDLVAATRARVTKEGVARALVAKLRSGALEAYRHQLDAQAGKAVSEDDAVLLAGMSRQL